MAATAAAAASVIVVVESIIDVNLAAVKITHVKVVYVDVVDGNFVVVIGVRVYLSIVEIYVLTTAPQYSSYV